MTAATGLGVVGNGSTGTSGASGGYWGTMGLIFMWGITGMANGGAGNQAVLFHTAFPNECLNLQLTCGDPGLDVFNMNANAISKTGFSVRLNTSGASEFLQWFAVGR